MKQRHTVRVAVFLILLKKEGAQTKVLLQKRQNTGYMDGKYDFAASGHLEPNEKIEDALIRETEEEIGLKISKRAIVLSSVDHDEMEDYVRFFFTCTHWRGEPKVMEPEKCGGLAWFDLRALPENLIDVDRKALIRMGCGVVYDM